MTPQDAAPRRVLVRHSEPIVAAGLVAALRGVPGLDVQAGEPAPAGTRPEVIVCEYDPRPGLVDAAAGAGLVVLARKARSFEIQEAIGRGVLGYLVSGCSLGELEGAVRAACQGRRFLCQAAAHEVANGLGAEALTTRERDVLELLAQGCCNKTIANALDIALGTVKAHVRAILAKLKASSRTEAASVAAARGLLPEPAGFGVDAPWAAVARSLPRVGMTA
jgi:DNA-binding CsgD family transcriptional regulator